MKPENKSIMILPERCKGCGFCIEFCPQHILARSTQINRKGYHPVKIIDYAQCSRCNICGMICPDFAISVVDAVKKC